LALLGLLGGCFYETSTPPTGPGVLVIGDSNVADGGPTWVETLGATYTTTVDGVPGADSKTWFTDTTWPQRISEVLAEHPGVAGVVQLGTNDAGTAAGAAAFAANVDAILAVIPSETVVLWNNVRLPVIEGWTAENVATVNAALTAATATWPNLQIEDEAGHPEWIADTALHFTPAGYTELASWTLANLNAALAP